MVYKVNYHLTESKKEEAIIAVHYVILNESRRMGKNEIDVDSNVS